jgi:hypothetical protein
MQQPEREVLASASSTVAAASNAARQRQQQHNSRAPGSAACLLIPLITLALSYATLGCCKNALTALAPSNALLGWSRHPPTTLAHRNAPLLLLFLRYAEFTGFHGIIGALLVSVKQIMPDHEVKLFGAIQLKARVRTRWRGSSSL